MEGDFEVIGHIVVDSSGAVAIQQINDQVDKMPAATGQASMAFAGLGTSIVTGFAGMAMGAISNVVGALTGFVEESVKAAMKHQDIMAQMTNVLENTRKSFDATTASTKQMAAGSDKLITVTVGSSKEIANVKKQLDAAQLSLTRATLSWQDHNKHTALATFNLQQAQQKVADLQGQYGKLTGTVQVHAGAVKQLNAGVDKNAAALSFTTEELEKLAKAQAGVTRFTRDNYLEAETLALRYDKIGKEIFPEVVKSAADLATATGVDLTSAMQIVTRAIGDPVMGIGRLNMQYKLFEPQQLRAIENMAKSGKTMEAQQIILDKLKEKFGGAAVAAGDTFAGKMDIFNHKIDAAKEKIGEALLPALSGMVDHLAPLIDKYLPVIVDFITNKVVPALEQFVEWLGKLIEWLGKSKDPIGDLWAKVVEAFDGIANKVRDAIADVLLKIGTFLQNLVDSWSADWELLKTIVSTAFEKVVDAIRTWLTNAVSAIGTFIASFLAKGIAIAQSIIDGIKSTINGVVTSISGGVSDAASGIGDFLGDFLKKGEAIIKNVVQGIKNFIADPVGTIRDLMGNIIVAISNFLSSILARGEDIIKNIIAGLQAFDPVQTIRNVVSNIIDTLKGLPQKMLDLGIQIIQSIIDGINKKVQELLDKVRKIGDDIGQKIKDALGIHSPSRVMIEVGRAIPEGIDIGIRQTIPRPLATMYGLMGVVGGHVPSSQVTSSQSTVNHYYFGSTLYNPRGSDTQELAQSFRKA